jgi:calcineurin-like phosphoesterase family protein
MTTFFAADLHLGHVRINELSGRPFSNVPAMNAALVKGWNDRVTDADTVWVLGDVCMGKLDDSLALIGLLAGRKLLMPGNHDRCLSEDMRAVTPHGFVKHSDLNVGDLVLSCDDDGNRIWLPITQVVRFPFLGGMTRYASKRFHGTVTPDHRVITKTQSGLNWLEWTGDQIARRDFTRGLVLTGTTNPAPDLDSISDDHLRLLGWCLTDGNYRARGTYAAWTLYQRESNAHTIRELLARLGVQHTETIRARSISTVCGRTLVTTPEREVSFALSAEATRSLPFVGKAVPAWCQQLSTRQFEVLLAAFVDGDGSYASGGGTTSGVLYCNQQEIRDDLQILMALNGYASSVSVFRGSDWRLNFCRRTACAIIPDQTEIETVPYDGLVWCVSVANGRFFVESEGRLHLTGNCWDGHSAKRKPQAQVQRYLDAGFAEVIQGPFRLRRPGLNVLLSHFPYAGDSGDNDRYVTQRPADFGYWLLHGHVHEKWRQRGRMINVGVDAWAGRPVSEDTIAATITAGPADLGPKPWHTA